VSRYEQLSVFDAGVARDDAIGRADAGAVPAWKDIAYAAVVWCAAHYQTFTSDEVLNRLVDVGAPSTPTLSALGPVMMRAARDGVIIKTGEQRLSRLRRRHRDLTVWRRTSWHPRP
jgi:hypothetical protein